jgi:hypothetical protein
MAQMSTNRVTPNTFKWNDFAQSAYVVVKDFSIPHIDPRMIRDHGLHGTEEDIRFLDLVDRNVHNAKAFSIEVLHVQVHTVIPPVIRAGVIGQMNVEVVLEELAEQAVAIVRAMDKWLT